MKEFDLNIEKVLENWEISHALREIIANALDEQVLTNTQDIEVYFDKENMLHIRDYGRGLKHVHLTQNENEEKILNKNLIGKFGVGLKDALATFDRNNKQVKILSKHGNITIGKSKKHGFEDVITLHAYIHEIQDSDFVGTEFIISNCSIEDINKAKRMFLRFSELKKLEETKYGEIYESENGIGNIYFNGVKIAEESNFMFSYNITSLNSVMKKALNRERTNVGRTAYTERVKSILLETNNEYIITKLIQNLNEYSSGTIKDELSWIEVNTSVVKKLNSRDNIVFVTPSDFEGMSGDTRDILDKSGKEIVIVNESIKEKVENSKDDLGNEITTLKTVMDEYIDSFKYEFVDYKDLSVKEKQIYKYTKDICKSYDAEKFLEKINISDTIRPDCDGNACVGVWDTSLDKIIIHRSQLKRLEYYSGTLIHELIHAKNGYDDVDRSFEIELTRVIGKLACNMLLKNKVISLE